nr:MAG TPA: hypothetical protein [Caudoviricetes sp.]
MPLATISGVGGIFSRALPRQAHGFAPESAC